MESIDSSVLSIVYGTTVTSIHDHWKKLGFDYMDLCQQSDFAGCFLNMLSRFVMAFLPRNKNLLISMPT